MSVLSPTIRAAISRFDKAAQEYAFLGEAEPAQRTAIKHQHENARLRLEREIERAIGK